MKNYKIAGGLAALLLSMSTQATVIDLFADPVGGQVVTDVTNGEGNGGFNESGPFPESILGGFRDIYVDAISGAIDNNGNGVLDGLDKGSILDISGGVLSFSNGAPSTGDVVGQAVIQWDGMDNSRDLNIGGLNNENFRAQTGCPVDGCDRFQYEVIAADVGFVFTLGIYTDANSWTELDLISSGTSGVKEMLFAFLENPLACGASNPALGLAELRCGASPVDLSDVGAMQLILNTENVAAGFDRLAAVDLTIASIENHGISEPGTGLIEDHEIPESGTIGLLGVGLLIGGLVRIRRTKKAKV